MQLNQFVPMLINQTVGNNPGWVVTSERWNELWNLNIKQGDNNTRALTTLVSDYLAYKETNDTAVQDRYTKAQVDAALATKLDKSVGLRHIKDVSFAEATGVLTFTKEDGSTVVIDTALEKVTLDVSLDQATGELVLRQVDGTIQRVSLAKFIDTYTFASTATITFSNTGKDYTAIVTPGSITLAHLEQSVMTTILGYVTRAEEAATASEASAVRAAASATQAGASADRAGASASTASSAASSATASKNEAAASATAAKADKDAAAVSSNTATTKANLAVAEANRAKAEADRAAAIAGGDYVTTPVLNSTLNTREAAYTEKLTTGIITPKQAGNANTLGGKAAVEYLHKGMLQDRATNTAPAIKTKDLVVDGETILLKTTADQVTIESKNKTLDLVLTEMDATVLDLASNSFRQNFTGLEPQGVIGVIRADSAAKADTADTATLATTANALADAGKAELYRLEGGTVIPASADLNTYKTVGNYYYNDHTQFNIINAPLNTMFTLKVFKATGVRYISQRIRKVDTPYHTFERMLQDNGNWTAWALVSSDLSSYMPKANFSLQGSDLYITL